MQRERTTLRMQLPSRRRINVLMAAESGAHVTRRLLLMHEGEKQTRSHTHHLGFNQFLYGANQLGSAGHLRGRLQGG